ALRKTPAGTHLLERAGRIKVTRYTVRRDKNRPEEIEGQSRTVVKRLAPHADDPPLSLQMALLADGVAESGRKMAWVDNGVVKLTRAVMGLDVQLAGTVAALAADGMPTKERRLIVVDRVGYRLHAVDVAKQAAGREWALEVRILLFESRRQAPPFFRGKPLHNRLEHVTVSNSEIGDGMASGAEDVRHLQL